MNQKPSCSTRDSQNGWILCPSKTFSDRYYYFNVLTGNKAWCLNENDKIKFNKKDDNVPFEPSSPPPREAESSNTSHSTSVIVKPIYTPRSNSRFENHYQETSASFGVATFPQYFPLQESYSCPGIPYGSNIWGIPNRQMYIAPAMPMSTPAFSTPTSSPVVLQNKGIAVKKSLNKVTQTPRESPDCVQTNFLPLSERSGQTNTKLSNNQHSFVPARKNIEVKQSKAESVESQQTNPFLTKNRPLTKSESIQANIGVQNCKCMQQHKRITMSEKSETVVSTTQEFKSNGDVKLLKPFAEPINPTGQSDKNQRETASGNYDLNETFTKTVQILNQSPEEETTDGIKVFDAHKDDTNFKSLDKNDLRHILITKRKKSGYSKTAPPNPEVGAKIKEMTNPLPSPAPKRVTFDIAIPQSLDGISSRSLQTTGRTFEVQQSPNEEVFNSKQDLYNTKQLRDLSKLTKKNWFIVVDLQVLIQELTLLKGLVNSDKLCRIKIPATVRSQLFSLCKGDFRTQPQVMAARNAARHVASNSGTFIAERQTGCGLNVDNGIIQCCYKVIHSGHHAILVSNDTELRLKANNIYCFTVQQLKNLTTSKQKATFNLPSINTHVQNKSAQKPLPETTIKPTYTGDELLFPTAEVNLKTNTSISLTEKKQNEEEKMQTKIDAQTYPIVFNRPSQLAKTTAKKAQNEKDFDLNDTKSTKDIIEEELEKFAIKHKELKENLSSRKEEAIVSFVQIMEDILTDILQTKTPPHVKELPPLNEAIECLKMCYQHDEKIKTVCEKFLDTITPDIKSCDFIRLAGCGDLLLESLKNKEPVNEAVTSLAALLVQLNSPVQDPKVAVVTKIVNKNDTHTEEPYKAFVKRPSEVIEYLKRHYPAWQTLENTTKHSQNEDKLQDIKQVEESNSQEVTIVRTFGRHLKNFRIHSTRNMTVETDPNVESNVVSNIESNDKAPSHEYDTGNTFKTNHNDDETGRNIVRKVGVIKEFEEKLKQNLNVDPNDNSEISLKDIYDDLLLKDLELSEVTTSDKGNIVDTNKQMIDNMMDNDGDNEKAQVNVDSVVTLFLDKLKETFVAIHNFVLTTKSEIIQNGRLKKKRRCAIYSEAKRAQTDVAEIMDTLRSIRDREQSDYSREALRVTYRQVVMKFLEQFELLGQALRVVQEILNRLVFRHRIALAKS